MLCEKCGKELDSNASFCPGCGTQINPFADPAALEKVNTWLIPAIISTVFCCLPFGIVSVVYAVKSNTAIGAGNIPAAQEYAAKAKIWFWVAFGVGIVWTVIAIVLNVFVALIGAGNV